MVHNTKVLSLKTGQANGFDRTVVFAVDAENDEPDLPEEEIERWVEGFPIQT